MFLHLKNSYIAFMRLTILMVIVFLNIGIAVAQIPGSAGNSISTIRDAEIESLIFDYTKPILLAAAIKGTVEVILVNDHNFNAFVSGKRIFIHTGALIGSPTPNALIGVIAHEVGHLAGGHQYRLRQQLETARTLAMVGTVVGIAGMATMAASGNQHEGLAGAGSGIVAGSGELALRNLLRYQRSEEIIADRLALNYLLKTEQSAQGILQTFSQISQKLSIATVRVDRYRISHPLPNERISALEQRAKSSPFFHKKDKASLQLRHDLARAKLIGHMGTIQQLHQIFSHSSHELPRLYGEAILTARIMGAHKALDIINILIKKQPKNPYFYEFLAETLLADNNPTAAAKAYQKAIQLDQTSSSLLKLQYGHCLLLMNDPETIARAITQIQDSLKITPTDPRAYHFLAMAYGRQGKIGLADLATADMHYYDNNPAKAHSFAKRALNHLDKHSPSWLRAQDLIRTTDNNNK